jgi:hypothetical protein
MKKLALARRGRFCLARDRARPGLGAARSAIPYRWKSCTIVNKRFPHGVGKRYAHDRVRGTTAPVTTFKRSTRLYNIAMSYNKRLDADKDGIACEKD